MEILSRFIVFEGLDGSGTSTQMKLLEERLLHHHVPVTFTSEPTDRSIGRYIRTVLNREESVLPQTMAMLYAADRNEHVNGAENGIRKLAQNRWVVCDRYIFSSLAYQSIDCGYDFVRNLNSAFPLPEHLLFLDVPPEVCEARLAARGNQDIFENTAFQQKVYLQYKEILSDFGNTPTRIHRIDGTQSADKVASDIWNELGFPPIV